MFVSLFIKKRTKKDRYKIKKEKDAVAVAGLAAPGF
tara:strand:- start:180 stop:287 length:108 start_codon:yes stop_codon:yes gene_type:complete